VWFLVRNFATSRGKLSVVEVSRLASGVAIGVEVEKSGVTCSADKVAVQVASVECTRQIPGFTLTR
jgi:hypothetical protein